MLRVEHTSKSLRPLQQKTLPEAGWRERDDLQHLIRNSPDEFFGEMGERLLLLGEEVRPAVQVEDRIDLLAVDPDGVVVVIELKRGSNKLQLLQSISYAAMVSKWDAEQLLNLRSRTVQKGLEDVESELEDFLGGDAEQLNASQRIVLIAEDFDFTVLASAEWLSDQYSLDIRCYRLSISVDADAEYLNCTCIFPPPELAQHAARRSRSRRSEATAKWANWDEALAPINNEAVVAFFQQQLAEGRERSRLPKRVLYFRIHGKRRLFVQAVSTGGYVWQYRRFQGDVDFWTETLGSHAEIGEVKQGSCLRFKLKTNGDFAAYLDALANKLPDQDWLGKGESPDAGDDDPESEEFGE